MERRSFLSKGLAALAGLVALPFAKMSAARTNPAPRSWPYRSGYNMVTGKPISLLDAGTWSNVDFSLLPAPRRRVLVMTSWRVPEDLLKDGRINLDHACDQRWMLTPRVAESWREVQFEELKKGDHFRLIDDCPLSPCSLHEPPVEDGKGIYVASTNAWSMLGEAFGPVRISGKHAIGIAKVYPGKGAGFDWYEVVWGEELKFRSGDWLNIQADANIAKRAHLSRVQGFNRG